MNTFPRAGNAAKKGDGKSKIKIKTDKGTVLDTFQSASKFMKSSQKYTLDDLERLHLFPNGESVKQTKDKAENQVSSFSMDGWEKKQLSEKEGKEKVSLIFKQKEKRHTKRSQKQSKEKEDMKRTETNTGKKMH